MPTRCSLCRKPSRDKLAVAYWAWFPVQNDRRSYKVRYCRDDAEVLAAIVKSSKEGLSDDDGDAFQTCWNCGTAMEESDWRVTYLSVYIPKNDPFTMELWTCDSCALETRAHVVDHGERLADRSRDASFAREIANPWASLL